MTINVVGHFFSLSEVVTDSETGRSAMRRFDMRTGLGDSDFRAFLLLHELGHLTGRLGDDRSDPSLSDTFNQRIMVDCFGKKNWKP